MTPEPADPVADRLRARAREVAVRLADEVEERALARVSDQLVERYAALLEQALVEELAARGRLPADSGAEPAPDRPEPAQADPTGPEPAETGWYLYAFAAGVDDVVRGEVGIDPDFPVEVLSDGPVAAVGSPVRLARLRQVQEQADASPGGALATAVQRHEQIVERTGRAVVPMRFGTVFPDGDAVRDLLARHRDAVQDELSRLGGCAEWGVKILRSAPGPAPVPSAPPTPTSGSDYLQRKSETRRSAAAARAAERELIERVHETLASHVAGAVSTPAPRSGSNGDAVVLNASYLVPAEAEESFAAAADRLGDELSDQGLVLRQSGPWPPYSFVTLHLSDEDAPR